MQKLRLIIERVIAFFYVPFKRLMPIQTFRYAFNGGLNTSLDIFLYFICYNYVLNKHDVFIGLTTISSHIASFLFVFPITFTTGFLLSKYITFTESSLHGKVQLVRYLMIVAICILLNYLFLKLFVEYCGIFPTPSRIITTFFVVIFSYIAQKHYTFKEDKKE